MATYLDLQTRIITETNRDDLSDTLASQLTLHIARAIEFYASKRFWFNEGTKTGVCVIGNEYAAKPSGLREIDRASITVGAAITPLTEKPLVYIDDLATVTSSGQPSLYAETGDQIRLWPKPNQAYPLGFIGIVDLTVLAAAGDTNAWTNQGYDLITARTKFTLYRNQFKDEAGAGFAKDEEVEALAKLSGETARRLGSGVRAHG